MGMPPATYLVPAVTNYWLTFPGSSPTGGAQQNVFYLEVGLGTTSATGLGIYVATLVYHIAPGLGSETLQLAFTSSNLIQDGTIVVPPGSIGISPGITISAPEPTTAMLIGLGVLGLALAGRRTRA